jgi:hypothetical protein
VAKVKFNELSAWDKFDYIAKKAIQVLFIFGGIYLALAVGLNSYTEFNQLKVQVQNQQQEIKEVKEVKEKLIQSNKVTLKFIDASNLADDIKTSLKNEYLTINTQWQRIDAKKQTNKNALPSFKD